MIGTPAKQSQTAADLSAAVCDEPRKTAKGGKHDPARMGRGTPVFL